MLPQNNITFFIFTYNEEKRIEYPVKCFLPYGEVLVVDNFSTDNTCSIAENLGATVVQFKREGPFDEMKEVTDKVLKLAKTDWVFWGFADDMAPKTCLEMYKKVSQGNRYKVVVQKRKTLMYDGKSEMNSGPIGIKFFRKDALDFHSNKMHKMGKFAPHVKPAEVLYLPPIDEYATYHFSRDTTEIMMQKIVSQAKFRVRSMENKISPLRVIFDPLLAFGETYIFYGTWRYGIKGLISSMRSAIAAFILASEKYELDNKITIDSIEKEFVKEKKKLLSSSPRSNLFQKLWAYFLIFFLSRLHLRYKFEHGGQ